MKTILLPTDFSKAALNAIDYGVEMAKASNAKIVLFHVYHTPIITSDVPIIVPSLAEIEKNSLKFLRDIEEAIYVRYGRDLEVECKCSCGLAVDEINMYAKENDVDLIIVGMQGSGYLAEKIIGSVTTSLMQKASCPVLSIDSHVKFKPLKKIVLACDYKETSYKEVLNPLKEIAAIYKSHVHVLNVIPELEPSPTVTQAVEGIKLEHTLEGVDHSFDYSHNENVSEGINDFVNKEKADMIAMIPRQHTIIDRIFKKSNTKYMAFHTHIPLLALH